MRDLNERGIAMITTLLVIMLMSALLVGFTAMIMSDHRYRLIDGDRSQAYYGASGAIEKLTVDLGNLFFAQLAPTSAQLTTLTATPPVINDVHGNPVVTYSALSPAAPLPASYLTSYYCGPTNPPAAIPLAPSTVGTQGYTIMFCTDATGNPVATSILPVKTGPYAGLIALQTPFQLDVTARTSTGGEVHLIRSMEAVAIPVFQFGTFSDVDLSFFAGPDFSFGGRVHTNGNLFLAEGAGNTLTLTAQVTAVGEVVRQRLQNNVLITVSGHTGTVNEATGPGVFRNLAVTEGSVVDGLVPAPNPAVYPAAPYNEPTWGTTSTSSYNSWLRNGHTGAKTLKLPLVTAGGSNPDLIRRPPAGEDVSNAILYNERMYNKASLRILLSDTAADITGLPQVTGTPVSLETNWNIAANLPAGPPAYGPISSTRPPPALSPGARWATVTGTGGGGPFTITFGSAALAAPFKPRFALCQLGPCAVAPAVAITCDVKTNTTFTGCASANVPTTIAGATLTSVSPAGGIGGVTSTVTTLPTAAGVTTVLTFAAGGTARFNPLPFWDTSTSPPTLVQCTGTYTATTLQGCSFAPAVGDIMVSGAMSDAGISTLGGFIKIDRQNADKTWTDVTLEILNYGIGGTNQTNLSGSVICGDPTPNAIVRLERLRDNGGTCDYNADVTGAKDPTNWWPNVLFDPREGLLRDSPYPGANNLTLGGVMHYVAIDAANLAKWFKHNTAPFNVAGSTGNLAIVSGTGYTVYFSDRRNNRDATSLETGEYGWEDFVNPAVANGVPNGTLETGEDVNGNGTLEVYGGVPNYNAVQNTVPPCALPQTCAATYVAGTGISTLTTAARPQTTLLSMVAQMNRPILFRRALMLINGDKIGANPVVADRLTGLTVVSENPVYIKGNWNAEIPAGAGFTGVNAATSVIADAVSLLSNDWFDANSFTDPYNVAAIRAAINPTWYRLAIIGGKGMAFVQPTVGGGIPQDFGTDGGTHNFLRFLENNGGITVNYMGATATFFYSRQAVGTYKCCSTVYNAPGTRAYAFDANFLNPALLPPNTPVFRDINAVGFSQELRPGK